MVLTKPRRPRQSVVGTTGCLTCRIRKVKCDEAKPYCQRCRATGRACDGYSVLPFSRPELLQASKRQGRQDDYGSRLAATIGGKNSLACVMLTDRAFQNKLEQRYFQFFRCCTVACTNLTAVKVDSPFWNRFVLQAFHSEPAVKHAILALAAMHGCMLDQTDRQASRQHLLYAKEQYTVALGEARLLVEHPARTHIHLILMVCLLFVAWEGVQGDYQASQRHMNSGRALFARFSGQIRARQSLKNIFHDMTQVLARMDISAMSFSDDSAPYHAPPHELDSVLQLVTQPFMSVQQASSSLMEITRRLLRLGNESITETNSTGLSRRQGLFEECTQHLCVWNGYWESWCADNSIDSTDSLAVINVQLWRVCSEVFVKTSFFSGPETRYDNALIEFRRMAELSKKLASAICLESETVSFSLDLGYLIPTFFIATRCRDPHIRRRALAILQSNSRHEGAWQSGPAAAIADKWIQIEEKGLAQPETAMQIPLCQRVINMEVQVRKSAALARLRFQLATVGGIGSVVEEVVTW